MFLSFHRASSQISVNVSTTTVTTTAEAGRLPLSATISSDSEGTIGTAASTPTGETEDERIDKVVKPDLKQGHDRQAAYPYFPAHPFRNPRHARNISIANTPRSIQVFALESDPCPFPSPPSPSLSRAATSPNQKENLNPYAMKSSSRFKFAKLLPFIPAGSKKRSRKGSQKGKVSGYHYQHVQDRSQQTSEETGQKSPSTLWRSEGYM